MFMKSYLKYAAMWALLLAAISCGPSYMKPESASQTDFAVSFLKSVNSVSPKNENVVVSPYSAALVLSMLAEGAQGQTRVEFDNALGGINLYSTPSLTFACTFLVIAILTSER